MSEEIAAPDNLDELKALVAAGPNVLAVGNLTKAPLSAGTDAKLVSLQNWRGVTEYQPSEFTFTARAGTTIAELESVLATKRQYLPFDPLLADAGATLGGTVASGLCGPGRFRYGGIRDFLLGVQVICGDGEVINAGGKVVKNAAGFDLPKFMVGTLGRFGVMTELTFKVFPRPIATLTIRATCASHQQAFERSATAASSRWELDTIDYRPADRCLLLRIAGPERSNQSIASEIQTTWGDDVTHLPAAADFWRSVCELDWLAGATHSLKLATTLGQSASLCEMLDADDISIHCSVAGNVMWVLTKTHQGLETVDAHLKTVGLPGLVIKGSCDTPCLGQWSSSEMAGAVKDAMDPPGRFPGWPATKVSC